MQTKKHILLSKTSSFPGKSTQHICRYCTKEFKFKQGLSKHIKHHCKRHTSKDESEKGELLEIVKSLNEQNACLQKEISKLNEKIKTIF
jgi:uncharacterized protein YlxW (UPF0749 family)